LAFRVSKNDQRECLHCKELFVPSVHNPSRQKFCQQPACRKARKTCCLALKRVLI
jgi:hypothetical protein